MKDTHRFTKVTVFAVFLGCLFLTSPIVSAQEALLLKTDDEGGWLGVSIQDLSTALKEAMDYDRDIGVLVNEVEDDSPAEEAGILEGDIIIQYDGKTIKNTGSLIRKVRATDPGDEVEIGIVRKGRDVTVTATIEKKSEGYGYRFERGKKGDSHFFKLKEKEGGWLGARLRNLTDQLGEYFGVSNGEGVLVTEVMEEGPAEKAGLLAGDVIVSYAGEETDDVDELIEAVRETEAGEGVEIEVIRNKHPRTLRAEIAAMPRKYRPLKLDRFGFPNYGERYDFRFFDDDLKGWKHFDDEEPEDTIWRYRFHGDSDADDLRDLKKRLKKLEREIEKMKDRL